jgi:hypothetical protein
MTNQEFSDTFTTMLNSYNTQANFGEQASKREIVLDEYEKSVLLTQAQDIIVKSYFDNTLNQQGQGFDDSTRRQMDFSSLIKVAELRPFSTNTYGENRNDTEVPSTMTQGTITMVPTGVGVESVDAAVQTFDDRGVIYQLPRKVIMGKDSNGMYDGKQTILRDTTDVLFILNERLIVKKVTHVTSNTADQWNTKDYVIVPINYKEYDREMSKPYAQPLKKQAWRLFQNSAVGFDINSELIPRWNIKEHHESSTASVDTVGDISFIYKIRYVKRPRPIILEDLPNDLEIDGETNESSCELNPIIHMDILNKAVELALATRGGSTYAQPERQRQQ